jgi:hypothetical protein
MNKQEVELIIFNVTQNGQDTVFLKIYGDGTITRGGMGRLPKTKTSAMSQFGNAQFLNTLLSKLPENVLAQSLNYEENTPNGAFEYVMAFYAEPYRTDEGIRWTKSTGMRMVVDKDSHNAHPLQPLLLEMVHTALDITNEWYFDSMLLGRYGLRSESLPEKTIVVKPTIEDELHADFDIYLKQLGTSFNSHRVISMARHKTYCNEQRAHRLHLQNRGESFELRFEPLAGAPVLQFATGQPDENNPWWRRW